MEIGKIESGTLLNTSQIPQNKNITNIDLHQKKI